MRASNIHRLLARTAQARGRLSIRLLFLVAAVLALIPVATIALFQLAPDSPSPATGHAQVIAHGVSAMPAASVAWRIVEDTAELPEQAVGEERALGFSLADADAIVVYDQILGTQQRLAAGEASFVATGSIQQRASLGNAAAPYFRIALVPAEQVSDTGGDRLVFAGDAWNAPAGDQFDVDLVRDVVEPNEQAEIPATNGTTAVLVTSGMIEVEVGDEAPVRLQAGEAANFSDDLAIFGIGLEPATYVAAAVGPEVPSPPAPPTGSITINVVGCPAGVTAVEAATAGFTADVVGDCRPVALPVNPTLILADNQPLEPDQPNPEQGSYTWNFLLYSPFPVADFELPDDYDSYLLADASGIVKASEGSGVASSVADPDVLFVSGQAPDAQATLFLFTESDDRGSISLAPFTCPEGMTADNLTSELCEVASNSFEVQITSVATGQTQTLADATTNPGSPFYTWSRLAPGDYMIDVPTLPGGYTDVAIPGLTPDAGTGAYVVRLTDEISEVQYNLFFVQERDSGANGSISATVFVCPPGMSRETLVGEACQPATGFDLNLYPPTGGALNSADASVQGNVVTWSDLLFGEYALEMVVLPPGYVDSFAPGVPVSTLSDRVYVVGISEGAPETGITIYNLTEPGPAPGQPPDDDG